MLKKSLFLTLEVFLFFSSQVFADFNFVNWPDPHWEVADLSGSHPSGVPAALGYPGATGGLNSTTPAMETMLNGMITQMAAHDPCVIIIPGDIGSGHWDKSCIKNVFAPGGTWAETIANAGEIYWTITQYRFAQQIPIVLAAVGDHEVGDNDWPSGSTVSNQVNNFRAAFGNAFNKDSNGTFLFSDPIGSVPSRPLGTDYDETSFAKVVNNVLFVTLDVFRQDSPTTKLHDRFGTVTGDVAGAHLDWVDDVLAAGQADPNIDHIFIQGHNPILGPVRKKSSSGAMNDNRGDSDLWQTFRKYNKVRVYFGGEVHADTASKDTESDILQIVVGRGTYMLVEVGSDSLEFKCYQLNYSVSSGSSYWSDCQTKNGNGSVTGPPTLIGTISADYSGAEAQFTSSGTVELMDQPGLIIHYTFDETSGTVASNTGSMKDWLYQGNKTSVGVTSGKLSNAAYFNGSAKVETSNGGICPVTEGEARTFAAWVKTTTTSKISIAGTGKSNGNFAGAFTMDLDGGIVGITTDEGAVRANGASSVTDGQWHHVAVVLLHRTKSTLGELKFYVDGVEYDAEASSVKVFTHSGTNSVYVGKKANNSTPFFVGDIDDFAMWGSALTAGKVRALVTAANEPNLAYNALDMEQLFDLYNAGEGQASVQGSTWVPARALSGNAGDVIDLGAVYAIVLDDSGNGVRQLCPGDTTLLQFDSAGSGGDELDCEVNFYDFAKFVQNWMDCTLVPAESCP